MLDTYPGPLIGEMMNDSEPWWVKFTDTVSCDAHNVEIRISEQVHYFKWNLEISDWEECLGQPKNWIADVIFNHSMRESLFEIYADEPIYIDIDGYLRHGDYVFHLSDIQDSRPGDAKKLRALNHCRQALGYGDLNMEHEACIVNTDPDPDTRIVDPDGYDCNGGMIGGLIFCIGFYAVAYSVFRWLF